MLTPSRPSTYQGDLANLPVALLPLTKVKRWVIWRWEYVEKHKRWTKVPYCSDARRTKAASNRPSTWSSYDVTLKAYQDGHSDGIGYMLYKDDVGAIDLDKCRNLISGVMSDWAEDMIREASDTYIEVSVSGTGARIWGLANGAPVHRKVAMGKDGAGFELYRQAARFSIVTANPINQSYQLRIIDHVIDNALLKFDGGEKTNEPDDEDVADDDEDQIEEEREDEDEEPEDVDRLTEGTVDDIIQNGAPTGQRSDQFARIVWWLANRNHRAADIVRRLAVYPNGIAAKYQGRLEPEVKRCYGKWLNVKRTRAAGWPVQQVGDWAEIECVLGETPRAIREAERAMKRISTLHYYVYAGRIACPQRTKNITMVEDLQGNRSERETVSWTLGAVTEPAVMHNMSCAARFLRFDRRGKYWSQINPPDKVVTGYFNNPHYWTLPPISGIATAPFLRSDGSLCETKGYDAKTGTLLILSGATFPSIPAKPTLADAKAALRLLLDSVASFPFMTEDAKAVALSGMLSGLDRRVLQNIPLHAFTAPRQGTGKTLLADAISIVATGHPAPMVAPGDTPEELTKRFDAAMLAGNRVILIDNVIYPFESASIAACVTHEQYGVRVLGQSRIVDTPADVLVMVTGNNLIVRGDLQRRSIEARLDARVEYPERREFSFNLLTRIRLHREALVSAALTIQRAYLMSGQRVAVTPAGSFEAWSYRVREALMWAGAGDAYATSDPLRAYDMKELALERVVLAWVEEIGVNKEVTTKEVINAAVNVPAFYDALLEVAASRKGDAIDTQRLGHWLTKHRDRVSNDVRVTHAGYNRTKTALWVLVPV